MPFSWLRVAKAQEGRAEQEAKEKAARENVWTRDSDLMGKLKAQEEEVRVGGTTSHAHARAKRAVCSNLHARMLLAACNLVEHDLPGLRQPRRDLRECPGP